MRYEFVSTMEVKKAGAGAFRRISLNVGIGCFVLAGVIDLWLGNVKGAALFILPLLYLINIRRQIASKTIIKPVPVLLMFEDAYFELVLQNTVMRKNRYYAEHYTVLYQDLKSCVYANEHRLLVLSFDGVSFNTFDTKKKRQRNKNLKIMLPVDLEAEIIDCMKEHVHFNEK